MAGGTCWARTTGTRRIDNAQAHSRFRFIVPRYKRIPQLRTAVPLRDVFNVHVRPFLLEIFRHQPAMAMFRSRFAAQQAAAVDCGTLNGLLHFALRHKREEFCLVLTPVALSFLVSVQELLRWGELWQMDVLDAEHGFTATSRRSSARRRLLAAPT